MNSMRHVQRAIEYEFQRQVEMLEKGETIVSETRSFDAQASNTFSLRSKEAANDYRYFPEPDLPPLFVDDDQIAKVKSSMPPLPEVLLERFTSVYGLSAYDASVLCDQKHLALWFEQLVNLTKHYKQAANWTMGPVKTWLNTHALEIHEFPLSVQALASLIDAVQDGLLTHHQAIQTLWPVWLDSPRKSLPNLLTELDLGKPSDGPPLELLVEEVLSSMPAKVKEYQSGKKGLLGLFMGELMKKTGGKVQPSAASEMLRSKLEG